VRRSAIVGFNDLEVNQQKSDPFGLIQLNTRVDGR
jgi:hypothetical protein